MKETLQEIKLVNYYAGQQLRVDDFKDEQSYLIEMRWLHNRSLHTWGISKGLEVNQVDQRQVKINPGIAIDNYGRELVLLKETVIDVVAKAPLSTSDIFYLTISYPTDSTYSNKCSSRTVVTPLLDVSEKMTSEISTGEKILLARLTIVDCTITVIDSSDSPQPSCVVLGSVRRNGDTMTGPLTIRAPFIAATNISNEIHALTIQGTVNSAVLEITADKNLLVDEDHNDEKGDSWIYFQTIEKGATEKSHKARIGWNDENGGEYFAIATNDIDRLAIKSNGKVGFGIIDPKEALQIGDRWTFHSGGSKVIGYNFYYGGDPPTDRRILEDEAAAIRFTSTGSIMLQTAKADTEDSIIEWKNALTVDNNGNVGITCINTPQQIDADMQIGNNASDKRKRLTIYGTYNSSNQDGALIIRNPTSNIYLRIDNNEIDCSGGKLYLNLHSQQQVQVGQNINAGGMYVYGNFHATGAISAGGSKSGYVTDRFFNQSNDVLEEGDVIVLEAKPTKVFYGESDNIPVPRAELTTKAYDQRVCGIVADILVEEEPKFPQGIERSQNLGTAKFVQGTPRVYEDGIKRLQVFSAKDIEKLDRKKIDKEQIGHMVTLGCFAHCKVDADIAPIDVGDLLTTSATKGHAQKVKEPAKALGAIIGKALGSLKKGKGKIPVLVMLQ